MSNAGLTTPRPPRGYYRKSPGLFITPECLMPGVVVTVALAAGNIYLCEMGCDEPLVTDQWQINVTVASGTAGHKGHGMLLAIDPIDAYKITGAVDLGEVAIDATGLKTFPSNADRVWTPGERFLFGFEVQSACTVTAVTMYGSYAGATNPSEPANRGGAYHARSYAATLPGTLTITGPQTTVIRPGARVAS